MATSTLGSGTLVLAGTTSGTTTVTATAVAGTTTLTLPAATDTLVGRATTDTLTNKTLTGAAMNGTVGATTPSTGAFTTLSATGNVTLGDASTDTLNVGNGDLVKDASGNFGVGIASLTQRFQVERSWDGSTWTKISNGNSTSGAAAGVLLSTDQGDAGALSQNSSNAAYGTTANAVRLRNLINAPITFETNGSERARVNTTGAFVFAGGTTTANGIGITFPATQSASTDANTLDDYEEGTWTPAVGGTATYNTQIGSYTKVGRLVYVRFNLNILLIGTGSTQVVSGLPFTGSATRMAGSMAYWAGLSNNVLYLGTFVDNFGFNFISQTASGKDITDGAAILGSGTVIHAAAVYFV